jgi:gliding motility-associated-like protein
VHSVTVTDQFGCTGIDKNFKVTQSAPVAPIYTTGKVCEGDTLTVYTSSLDSNVWSSGETSDSILMVPGFVSLTVTDKFNCVADSSIQLFALPSPIAAINMNPNTFSEAYLPVGFNDDSELNGSNIVSWYWNVNDSITSGAMDTVITFYEGMPLTIVHALTSDSGCTDTISISYRISDDIVKVNVITPNGDGVNDYLVFPNLQKFPNNRLHIFNRWGVELVSLKPYRNLWDAHNIPDGTYFYVLELDENVPAIKGSFTIIR